MTAWVCAALLTATCVLVSLPVVGAWMIRVVAHEGVGYVPALAP